MSNDKAKAYLSEVHRLMQEGRSANLRRYLGKLKLLVMPLLISFGLVWLAVRKVLNGEMSQLVAGPIFVVWAILFVVFALYSGLALATWITLKRSGIKDLVQRST